MPVDAITPEHPFKSAGDKQHFPLFDVAMEYDHNNDTNSMDSSIDESIDDSSYADAGKGKQESAPVDLELSIETQVRFSSIVCAAR